MASPSPIGPILPKLGGSNHGSGHQPANLAKPARITKSRQVELEA